MQTNVYTLWVDGEAILKTVSPVRAFKTLVGLIPKGLSSLKHPSKAGDILLWYIHSDKEFTITCHGPGVEIELTQVEELDGDDMPTGRMLPAYDIVGLGKIKVSHTAGYGYNYQFVS